MANKTFNVGIVGYGMSAKIFHIPFIATTPQLTLHAITQRSPREGNSAPSDYPDLKHFTDVDAMLADADIDVVVITTPPNSHFALTKAALEAGKHVLTEKPFVPTSAEAEALIALADEKQRLLCVYQNRRWDSDFLTLRHLVDRHALGRVVELHTHFDRYRARPTANWKVDLDMASGGSAVFDLGTHLIDQVYTLFGLPRSVRGRLLNQREGRAHDPAVPDGMTAELAYPDGMIANVRVSVLSAETEQPRFWVRGTGGSFHKTGLDPQEDQLKAGVKPTAQGFGRDKAGCMRLTRVGEGDTITQVEVPELAPETYMAFYAALGKAVASGRADDVPVKAHEAKDVLRIIEAVIESANSGKEVTF